MKRIGEFIAKIANDHTSGSTAVTALALEALRSWVTEAKDLEPKKIRASLQETGQALIRSQPAMGAIFNLVNRVLWTADDVRAADEICESVAWVIDEFERIMRRSQTSLTKNSLSLVPDDGRIVTLSSSSAVYETLKMAHTKGRRFEVICAESRPLCEGIELAKRLADVGISCEVIVDAHAPSRVEHVDLVLVGGDGVTASALVNKVGTYGLALAARWHHVPCAALVMTQKFFPPAAPLKIPLMSSAEILSETPPNVRVTNRYFEETPLSFVSVLMTENGRVDRRTIARMTRAVHTHPSLKKIAL
ncbi:hypothetical protein HYR54_15770 [Candidatus Acetothermia bacterium]|nr:hypothetical protein [Candidatus Acetothermia bacterium]